MRRGLSSVANAGKWMPRMDGALEVTRGTAGAEFLAKFRFSSEIEQCAFPSSIKHSLKSPPYSIGKRVVLEGEQKEVLVSLGEEEEVESWDLVEVGGETGQLLRGASVGGEIVELDVKEGDVGVGQLGLGLGLGLYRFDGWNSSMRESSVRGLSVPDWVGDAELEQLRAELSGAVLARDLSNARGDVVTPGKLEEVSRAVVGERGSVEVVCGREALLAERLEMLSAVGQAAERSGDEEKASRLILMDVCGEGGEDVEPIVLVGKGVTFDTGGLQLKTSSGMLGMHMDMGGAAAVLGAMHTLLQGGEEVLRGKRVVGVIGAVENAISSHAYFPLSLLTSHAGKTVEVNNTDAEGRLVLADAISYALSKHTNAKAIIDIATLTGAAAAALGYSSAPVFSNSSSLTTALQTAGAHAAEHLHPFPLRKEYVKALKSDHADTRSTGNKPVAGACTAAAFLHQFLPKEASIPWAHIDIAGTAMRPNAHAHLCTAGTGFGALTLANAVKTIDTLPNGVDLKIR